METIVVVTNNKNFLKLRFLTSNDSLLIGGGGVGWGWGLLQLGSRLDDFCPDVMILILVMIRWVVH